MNIKLVDSSEFHGSPEAERRYTLFKIKSFFQDNINPTTIKYILYVVIWFIGGRLALEVKLHGIYAIMTGFAIIFFNLGERQKGTMSAYSLFNKGFYTVLGTFSSKDVDNMFTHKINQNEDDDFPQFEEERQEKSEFDGLSDDQMMAKLSKLGNKPCFCDSGRKYKKCHYYLQQRAKQQEAEEKKKKLR